MAGVNRVTLVGHLGADPDVQTLQSGQTVCKMSLATSESWKDKETGERKEKTEWHRLVAWGKQAELCAKYLAKGKQIFVEGKLQTRSYEKDGVKRWSTEIVVSEVQFLGAKEGGGGARREEAPLSPEPPIDVDDGDIPF